jgi:hypothetical protein
MEKILLCCADGFVFGGRKRKEGLVLWAEKWSHLSDTRAGERRAIHVIKE